MSGILIISWTLCKGTVNYMTLYGFHSPKKKHKHAMTSLIPYQEKAWGRGYLCHNYMVLMTFRVNPVQGGGLVYCSLRLEDSCIKINVHHIIGPEIVPTHFC